MSHFTSTCITLVLVALVACCAVHPASATCTRTSCPLEPFEDTVVWSNQLFCINESAPGALQGTGCESLQYCCSAFSDFSPESIPSSLLITSSSVGNSPPPPPSSPPSSSGAQTILPGQSLRLEFVPPLACVVQLTLENLRLDVIATVRITLYQMRPTDDQSYTSTSDVSIPPGATIQANIDQCHVLGIALRAPNNAGVALSSLTACLVQAQLDSCGACGGDGRTCNGTSDAPQLWNPSLPLPLVALPVLPTLYCHTPNSGDGLCCTGFGYKNPNPTPVYLSAGTLNNYFTPRPASRNQTSMFVPGVESPAVVVHWPCAGGATNIHLQWTLDTPTTSLRSWPNSVQVHRDQAITRCPVSLC
jgi:hypothetical protein